MDAAEVWMSLRRHNLRCRTLHVDREAAQRSKSCCDVTEVLPPTSGPGIRHDGRADTCSLLLTQLRYEHGNRFHDTSAVFAQGHV